MVEKSGTTTCEKISQNKVKCLHEDIKSSVSSYSSSEPGSSTPGKISEEDRLRLKAHDDKYKQNLIQAKTSLGKLIVSYNKHIKIKEILQQFINNPNDTTSYDNKRELLRIFSIQIDEKFKVLFTGDDWRNEFKDEYSDDADKQLYINLLILLSIAKHLSNMMIYLKNNEDKNINYELRKEVKENETGNKKIEIEIKDGKTNPSIEYLINNNIINNLNLTINYNEWLDKNKIHNIHRIYKYIQECLEGNIPNTENIIEKLLYYVFNKKNKNLINEIKTYIGKNEFNNEYSNNIKGILNNMKSMNEEINKEEILDNLQEKKSGGKKGRSRNRRIRNKRKTRKNKRKSRSKNRSNRRKIKLNKKRSNRRKLNKRVKFTKRRN